MYVCAVVGPSETGKTTLVERLVDRLAPEHAVATVKHCDHGPAIDVEGKDTARHRAAGARTTVGIGDGRWIATGEERTLRGTLDEIAATHDYAVVEGYSESRLPKVALGNAAEDVDSADNAEGVDNAESAGRVDATADDPQERLGEGERTLFAAPTADDVNLDALFDAIHDTEPYESLSSLVAQVKRSPDADRAGAIATFTGRVREKDDPDDPATEHLAFEKYERVADERMAALREELLARDGVHDVRLHHRTGVVRAGEDIVFVVILAGHRREAFAAVEDGIDRLKAEVPLFKKEVTVDGEFWAHEH